MMEKIFLFLEGFYETKFQRFIRFIFLPIFILLEYIVYHYYWKKIILTELITNEELFNFLDKNEFALYHGKLYKKDIYDDKEFYDALKPLEVKAKIKVEFEITLIDLINKYVTINIENYLVMLVEVSQRITKIDGVYYENKLYSVSIQFCRYHILINNLKQLIYWIPITIIQYLLIANIGTLIQLINFN